jgi:hypothetical protein
MARARKTLAQFIREALTDSDKLDKNGSVIPCTSLALVHKRGESDDEVHVIRLVGANRSAEDLAKTFQGKADGWSQDKPGTQTFNILCYYGGDPEPQARIPFAVQGQDFSDTGLGTEGPSPAGQTQQMMRQSEMVFLQAFRQQNVVNEMLIRHSDGLSRHVERLETENRDVMILMKDILMTQAANRHEYDKELRKMDRNTKLMEIGMKHGPTIINTLSGKEVFPQSMTDTAIIEAIAESVDEPMMMKMMELFGDKPHLAAMIMPRFNEYMERKAAAEAALKERRTPPNPSDGESDAAGDR